MAGPADHDGYVLTPERIERWWNARVVPRVTHRVLDMLGRLDLHENLPLVERVQERLPLVTPVFTRQHVEGLLGSAWWGLPVSRPFSFMRLGTIHAPGLGLPAQHTNEFHQEGGGPVPLRHLLWDYRLPQA